MRNVRNALEDCADRLICRPLASSRRCLGCRSMTSELAARIDALLPQTQCTRCGYPTCRAYANAIARDETGKHGRVLDAVDDVIDAIGDCYALRRWHHGLFRHAAVRRPRQDEIDAASVIEQSYAIDANDEGKLVQ